MLCENCGLFDFARGFCYRFKKEIGEEKIHKEECLYFYKIKKEAGEPLSPEEHLLLQDNELKNKKMRGPV